MRKKLIKYFLFYLAFTFLFQTGYSQRNWLGKSATKEELATFLMQIKNWRHAQKATLQKSVTHLPDEVKDALIQNGEKYLSYAWPSLLATQFLEFSQTGNRSNYESSRKKRRTILSALVIAELVEGKGRFLPQIVNGIWLICEESSWAFPAHLSLQKKYTPLPNPGENIVDLGDGMTAALLSWTYLLLYNKLDSITAVIPSRMQFELEKRVINPYLQRNDYWWMGFQGQRVNNWNPWVNGNVLLTSLLTEKDKRKMTKTVYKTMQSTDHFINQYPADGGCDEGPSYWSVAGGALISYLDLLDKATRGRIDVTNHPLLCNMGRYIYRMNIDKNYFVNYGDAHPTTVPDIASVFAFGEACENDTMKQFAAYFAKADGNPTRYLLKYKGNLQKFINYLHIFPVLRTVSPHQPLIKKIWLPDSEVLTIRNTAGSSEGLFLSAKGGTNGESHNHNDVGNFIIYVNGRPAIIDIGVGTYTRQTFSGNRYKIFTMQSAWHNLPTINGVMQHAGSKFRATKVRYAPSENDTKIKMDIAEAYPAEAAVRSWVRTLTFKDSIITLTENYVLSAFKSPASLSLITPMEVKVEEDQLILKDSVHHQGLRIGYSSQRFNVSVETKLLEDPSLKQSWGQKLHKIVLANKSRKLKGNYQINFQPLPKLN